MTVIGKPKSVALTFRGFEVPPTQVEELIGIKASKSGAQGTPVRPGVKAILKRSFAMFALELDRDVQLDQAIPMLVAHLGGVDNIKNAREGVSPEFLELDIRLPVKRSEEQEGGFIPAEVIAELFELRCSLAFSFV